jgi:hypothetical protein
MQNSQETEVFVATAAHLLFGKLQTSGSRVQEILNDSSTDFLRLRDATVFRGASVAVRPAPLVVLAKHEVVFVALSGTKYEAPGKRAYAFADKKHCTCFVLASNYEIEGTLSLKGSADPVVALNSELSDFFPIADPKIGNIGDQKSVPAAVALVNKSMISAIEVAVSQPSGLTGSAAL